MAQSAVKTVLVTGARAPVALHWARLLHGAGHHVLLADSHRFPFARFTRLKAGYRRLPPPCDDPANYAQSVARLVEAERIDLVVPTCEEVFYLAAARDLYGLPIPLSAPPFSVLRDVHDKFAFASAARGLGADPPATHRLDSRDDVAAWRDGCGHAIFKPVWSRFAERVLIRPQPSDLDRIAPTPTDPWVAQNYLPGEELCAWALARDGRLQALQAYRPLYRAGKGASLAFEAIDDGDIAGFVGGFVQRFGWTGQVSFDFRRDAGGALHAIECNPRATSGLHFFGPGGSLADCLFAPVTATATLSGAMTLPMAMLVYALPPALRTGTLSRWWRDLRAFGDISAWPGDRSLMPAQLLALAEIAMVAATRRIGLKAAATADIEWNGEPIGP